MTNHGAPGARLTNEGAPAAPFFTWRLRPVVPADVPALAALYRDAALRLGPQVYTPEQVGAWVSFGSEVASFERYVLDADTCVAEREGAGGEALVGFSGFSLHGATAEVHSLYVRAGLGRRGLGWALLVDCLGRALAAGAGRIEAWATPFSRTLFARAGMPLVEAVQGEFEGVMFERYRMAGDAAAISARLSAGSS